MNKLISIIVPVYNADKFLSKCLDSILTQTYNNIEIILVNDGSSDKSGEICDEYAEKDSRIKVIHKENGGQSTARNCALDICKGDYIGFVDADDWISSDMFETLCKNLEQADADISICQCKKVNKREDVPLKNSTEFILLDRQKTLEYFYKQRVFECHMWNKLYRRNLFDNIRFPEGKIYEDEDAMYKLLWGISTAVYTDKECYYYYEHELSTVHKKFNDAQLNKLNVYQNAIIFFEKNMPEIVPYVKYRWLDGYIALVRDAARSNTVSEKLLKEYSRAKEYSKGYLFPKYIKPIYKISWFLMRININLFSEMVKLLKI